MEMKNLITKKEKRKVRKIRRRIKMVNQKKIVLFSELVFIN